MEMMTQEIRDRIFSAADELYQQSGRETFPTVDVVRKAARVNMNDASVAMKEWRRQRTTKAAPLAVQVPESVLTAATQAMAVLWQQAQDLANESLKAAQSGWESERAELDALRSEMGDAYQALESELDAERERVAGLEKVWAAEIDALRADLAAAQAESVALRADLAAAQESARAAASMAQESDRRADALAVDLAAARHDAEQARSALAAITADLARSEALRESEQVRANQSAAEIDALRARLDAAQGERDQARQGAASLEGQVQAMREQIAALLARIPAPRQAKKAASAPKPRRAKGKRAEAPEVVAAAGS